MLMKRDQYIMLKLVGAGRLLCRNCEWPSPTGDGFIACRLHKVILAVDDRKHQRLRRSKQCKDTTIPKAKR